MKSMCFKVCSQISELVRNVSPGQTGMCGGVRGVSAGGIVSSCFCLLYKLYTLKVTKKQVQFTSLCRVPWIYIFQPCFTLNITINFESVLKQLI